MEKEIYNGFKIRFDEKKEVWYTNIDQKGKQSEYDSADERLENVSLKNLKEMLDKVKRSKFERMPVFVSSHRYGMGIEENYSPQYVEATLTSIAPNGNAYTVKKGEKYGEKTSLEYSSRSIILDTPANRAIIFNIEKAGMKEWKAEEEQKNLKEKLKYINGKKVYKEVYGKEL